MTSSRCSEHAQKQKQLEAEIAERILKEEQLMKRKKVLYPNLFSTAESEKKKVGNPCFSKYLENRNEVGCICCFSECEATEEAKVEDAAVGSQPD